MEVQARVKTINASPKNLRNLIDTVRGMRVEDAISQLRFTPIPMARIVRKAVESAAANAENNYDMVRDELRIVKIIADEGARMKRFKAKPRGRAAPIIKRTSHLTVVVDQDDGED